MTAKTWSGGNWSDTTKWTGSALPTASDDVTITSGTWSGTLDVSTAVCRSIDFTNGSNQTILTLNASSKLTIGTSTVVTGNFALKFPTAGAKAGITDNGGEFDFISTSATQITISSSYTLPKMVFNGAGGSWLFSGAITSDSSITLTAGTLNTNGVAVTCTALLSTNSNTRTLTLGASTITINGSAASVNNWDFTTTTGLTFNANTSTIDFTTTDFVNGATMQSGGKTFNNITADCCMLTIAGAPTCANLACNGVSSKPQNIILSGNITVQTNFKAQPAGQSNRIFVKSDTIGTARTISVGTASVAGTCTLQDVVFEDITFANVKNAGTKYSGTRVGNGAGNSGDITFDSNLSLFWISGTGNWGDTTHWSTSSGGASGARVPLPQDTATIDTSSGFGSGGTISYNCTDGWFPSLTTTSLSSGTVTIQDANPSTLTFNWLCSGTITLNSAVTMTMGNISNPTLESHNRSSVTWTFGGSTWTTFGNSGVGISVKSFGSTLIFADNPNWPSVSGIILVNGTLDCSTHSVSLNVGRLTDSGTATKALTAGSGTTITLNDTSSGVFAIMLTLQSTGTTFTTNSCNLVISGNTSNVRQIFLNAKTFSNITLSSVGSGGLTINGGATCSIFTISGTSTISVVHSTTLTVSDFQAWGASGNLITITSDSAGVAFTISKSSGIVVCDWISLKDCTISGGLSKAYAGGNSTNVSGNTGWTFTKEAFINPQNPLNGLPQTFAVRQAMTRASYW